MPCHSSLGQVQSHNSTGDRFRRDIPAPANSPSSTSYPRSVQYDHGQTRSTVARLGDVLYKQLCSRSIQLRVSSELSLNNSLRLWITSSLTTMILKKAKAFYIYHYRQTKIVAIYGWYRIAESLVESRIPNMHRNGPATGTGLPDRILTCSIG
jgi:hypothetical protein